jgi:acetyltransferase-like isoleucine patch superfamily enzyme
VNADRTLPWDWYTGSIPPNVRLEPAAYVETAFSFYLFRGEKPDAVVYGPGASTFLGTMFDVGPAGKVTLGRCALVHGARIICDSKITIGDYALISWNVVLMDTYRTPLKAAARRAELERVPTRSRRFADAAVPGRPVRIERNVWIGFDACILPGVTVGEGSVVGARSVVTSDVPPFTVFAGNPARLIRRLDPSEIKGSQ